MENREEVEPEQHAIIFMSCFKLELLLVFAAVMHVRQEGSQGQLCAVSSFFLFRDKDQVSFYQLRAFACYLTAQMIADL